jgi:hypothetical protein
MKKRYRMDVNPFLRREVYALGFMTKNEVDTRE